MCRGPDKLRVRHVSLSMCRTAGQPVYRGSRNATSPRRPGQPGPNNADAVPLSAPGRMTPGCPARLAERQIVGADRRGQCVRGLVIGASQSLSEARAERFWNSVGKSLKRKVFPFMRFWKSSESGRRLGFGINEPWPGRHRLPYTTEARLAKQIPQIPQLTSSYKNPLHLKAQWDQQSSLGMRNMQILPDTSHKNYGQQQAQC